MISSTSNADCYIIFEFQNSKWEGEIILPLSAINPIGVFIFDQLKCGGSMKKTFLYSVIFFIALLFSFASVASAKGSRGYYSYSSGSSYSHSSSGTSPSYSTSGKSASHTSSNSSSGSKHSVLHDTGSSYSSSTAHSHNSGATHKSTRCSTCPRDKNGHIKRSPEAKSAFMKSHPCPSTGKTSGPCPGYVVDHIKPLKRGDADSPDNMQWQTTEAAKAKDKWE